VRTIRTFSALVFAFGFSVAASRALAQQDQSQSNTGDPVADAARKAREQKKTSPKPKKVFTDEDVASKPAAEVSAPTSSTTNPENATASETQPATPVPKEAASTKTEDVNSEAYWRKRFAAQHKKIADAEEELIVLQREAEKADVQYYPDPQKAMKEQYTRQEINDKNDKIAAKRKEISDLKQQLSDMEDELHRTGGDSGWAR
jgi:chromosome segregation ATPase